MTWPMVKIKDIFDVARGGSPRPIDSFITDAEDGVNWIMIGDTKEGGKYIEKTAKKIKPEGVKNSREVKEGDFLLTNSMSFGRPYILKTSGCIHDGWLVLSPRTEEIHKDYFYYYLGSQEIKSKLASKAAGAVVKNLNKDIVKELEIPCPPLAEQKRIAAILDKADAICQKRQQAIALADQFLRSVFLDMFGDPVTNPKGWEVIKLGSCCRFQGGFAFKSEDYCDSGIPLVKITNVHFENIDWSDVSYVPADFLDTKAEFALKDEDLVMAMTRPIIKSLNAVKVVEVKEMDLPCLLNQRVGRFIDYENSFKKHFLKYLLYSDFFMNEVEKLCSVALQPNISSKQIEAITCYIPPIELQDEFSQIAKQVEQTIPHMSSFNDLDLFGSLNSKAFSGQL